MSPPHELIVYQDSPPSESTGHPHLPPELIDACLECLHDDSQTLRECLFVARTTLFVCRKHLFRVVSILAVCSRSTRWDDLKAFYAFWHSSKHLLPHVKELTFEGPSLRKFGGFLDLFAGAQLERFNYEANCSTLLSSSIDLALMRSFLRDSKSTLVEIHLTRVYRFPVDMLSEFPNLKKFCFYPKIAAGATSGPQHVDTDGFDEDITKLPREKSISLSELWLVEYMTPETWFDLCYCLDATTLRELKLIHRSPPGFEPLQTFLETVGPYIQHLIFRPSIALLSSGIRTSTLHLSQFSQLQRLEFRISYALVDLAFLRWVYEELRVLPSVNPLREVIIKAPWVHLKSDHICDRTRGDRCHRSRLTIVNCISRQQELSQVISGLDRTLAGFPGLNKVQVFCYNLGLDDVFPALAALGRLIIPVFDPYSREAVEENLDDNLDDQEPEGGWGGSDIDHASVRSDHEEDSDDDFSFDNYWDVVDI